MCLDIQSFVVSGSENGRDYIVVGSGYRVLVRTVCLVLQDRFRKQSGPISFVSCFLLQCSSGCEQLWPGLAIERAAFIH